MTEEPALSVLHPASLADAVAMVRDGATGTRRYAAGATAIQLEWARGLVKPSALVDLGRIPGLAGIAAEQGYLGIGASTPLASLVTDRRIGTASPLLAAAARTVAGPAVRNLGTIGGNVAGRTGCLLPPLLALNAELDIFGRNGPFREDLADWLGRAADPADIITAIRLPAMTAECRWTQRKIGLRAAFTPSIIGVAGILDIDGDRILAARLADGGGIVQPTRLNTVETSLAGQSLTACDWHKFRHDLLAAIKAPDDDFRSGRYRRTVAANALACGLAGGLPKSAETPGHHSPSAASSLAPPLPGEIRLAREEQQARWFIRPDLPPKVNGTFAYLTDHRAPDMLVGRILRAGVPHASILAIDTRAAEALPGVVAVVTHRDVPGENAFGIVVQDQPAFCCDKVRYVGDAVAAVAAIDAATAERALTLIKVDYEALPVVTTPEQALAADAPAIHETGNLQRILHFSRGDIEAGFTAAAHVVEDTYVTPRQMHGFMETEGGHARIEPDGSLAVFVGGQHGSRDRLQLSRVLAMPEDRIRVVTNPTGGAFGGKDELTVQPALALLAIKSGRPVRLQLSRAESVLAGTKRNPMTIRMRTACDADGRLLAQEVDVLADAGAYASLGPGVLETALEHAGGPYVIDNVSTRGRLAYTNNGTCGAFRGFGANQMTYALECQMDRLAERCGLTPAEIRRRNLKPVGAPGYLGQDVAPSERLDEMLLAAETSPIWREPRGPSADGTEIVGIGMAMNYQGNGLGSLVPDPAGGRLSLSEDGFIEAAYGLDEMGQGLLVTIQSAVLTELGCGRNDIRPVTGDTALAPESGSTTASRGTFVVWKSAQMAAPQFARAICEAAARLLARDTNDLRLAPGGIAERLSNSGGLLMTYTQLAAALPPEERPSVTVTYEFPKNGYAEGNARYIFAFGACLARVAVSRLTGQVRVLDLVQHTAAGPVMDIAAYLGQMEGGAVQGIGFTLSEDAAMKEGRYVTANLDTYMLPGIADTPQTMHIHALEGLDAGDDFGPRGAGELGIGAVTPAIANAVADAVGYRPPMSPFSPEAVLDAMEAMP